MNMTPARFIVEWVRLGAYVARMTEKGIIFHDLSPDNLGVDEETNELSIIDLDAFDRYPFPGEIHVHAAALFSLLGYLPIHFAAAFRFGFIHHAARFGRLVFDHLRHDFGLVPWASPVQVPTIARLDENGWAAEHTDWMARRDRIDLPELENAFMFPHLLRPERSRDIGEEVRATDPELAFHAFERQLIVELMHEDPQRCMIAITNIGALAAERGEKLRAQTWGSTLMLLAKAVREQGPLWPNLLFWLSWSAEEEGRAIQAK